MFIIWSILSVLALVTIWVLPPLAKVLADSASRWVKSGKKPRLRFYAVKSFITACLTTLSLIAAYFSYTPDSGYDPYIGAFDKLAQDYFSLLFWLAVAASGIFAVIAARYLVGIYIEHITELPTLRLTDQSSHANNT